MVKVIHAADFHLDSAFFGLPEEKARQRRRESRDSLERLANFANAEQADLILLSGDLFDGAELYPETKDALRDAFAAMNGRVFIAPGNHDFYTPRGAWDSVTWSDNVHIFRTGEIEAVPLPELSCTVYGAAFTAADCTESLLKNFRAAPDGNTHIMVLHGEVNASSARYDPLTEEEIAQSGLSYLALGHVHSFSGLHRSGETTWAYPGCPEGRGFDECGEKGILAGTVSPEQTALRFVGFARRKYEILRVDVTGLSPRRAVESALPESTAADLYRIVLTGTTDETKNSTEELEQIFSDRFYELSLRDETRVAQDIWEKAEEDSLRGLFLRELHRRMEAAPDDDARRLAEQAARFGLAALDGRDR